MCKPAHLRKNEFEPLNSKINISFLKSSLATDLAYTLKASTTTANVNCAPLDDSTFNEKKSQLNSDRHAVSVVQRSTAPLPDIRETRVRVLAKGIFFVIEHFFIKKLSLNYF